MKRAALLLLLTSATVCAQWSDTVTAVTSGSFDDINPQVDHGGLLFPYYQPKEDWLVFERWSGGSDAIAAVKYDGAISKWDTNVVTIAAAESGIVRKCPDVCTLKNGISLAAWDEKSDSVWNIYYSLGNIGGTIWSSPSLLTRDSVSDTNVEVRPLSDSTMVLIWKRGRTILYSIYGSGGLSAIETLAYSNADSTEFDFDGSYFVWTDENLSGNMFCLESAVKDSAGLHISQPDSIGVEGSISCPRFTIVNGESGKYFTFNVYANDRFTAWWYYYWGINGWTTAELAAGPKANYILAVQLSYPELTANSRVPFNTVQSYFNWMVVAEKYTASDTSIVFFGDSADSLQPGSNPVISSLAYVVWQSDSSGSYHLYSRSYNFVSTGIEQQAASPASFKLCQNYPNPFNPSTAISYELSANCYVSLKVYDILGREVATLVNAREGVGAHTAVFDGSKFASGVYFYRLAAPGANIVRKMLLLK